MVSLAPGTEWPMGPEGMRAQQLATDPNVMSDRDLAWALSENACRSENKNPGSCPLVAYLEDTSVRIQDGCRKCLANTESALATRFPDRTIDIKPA